VEHVRVIIPVTFSALVIGGAAYLVWYSPPMLRRAVFLISMYSACVDAAPPSDTLGDAIGIRVHCYQLAGMTRIERRKSP
jgi:hypothetical protein